jgi:hypothetical protein
MMDQKPTKIVQVIIRCEWCGSAIKERPYPADLDPTPAWCHECTEKYKRGEGGE